MEYDTDPHSCCDGEVDDRQESSDNDILYRTSMPYLTEYPRDDTRDECCDREILQYDPECIDARACSCCPAFHISDLFKYNNDR
jgi:hypothetical protein